VLLNADRHQRFWVGQAAARRCRTYTLVQDHVAAHCHQGTAEERENRSAAPAKTSPLDGRKTL